MATTQSRNALCDCGSGQKYKKCCGSLAGGAATAPALFAQGVRALKAGQLPAAMQALLAAVQIDSTHGEAFHALGSTLMQAGRLAQASAILQQAAMLRPDSAPVQWDLGAALDRQDLHEQAIAAYRRAVALAPALTAVHLRLGQLYAQYCRVAEASESLTRAAALKPNTVDALLYLSDARMLLGDIDGAEELARKAVAFDPARSAAHAGLAGLLYHQGRFDEAAASYEVALRHDPGSAKSWHGLAHCRRYAKDDAGILDRMAGALGRAGLPDEGRMAIHFAMGKIYDDCGAYAQAMAQFDAAAELRGRGPAFDRAGLAALVDRNIAVYTREFLARKAAAGVADATPVFIAGMYRSGTTLVEQIVSSHRDVAAGGELTVWGPMDLEIDPATGDLDPAGAAAAIAKYLAALREIGGSAARVTDKLPPNVFRLGAIHALLPGARIVHCERDPVDTCLSIYSTLFTTRLAFAARKADLVFYYGQYRRMMDHWRRVLPESVLLDVQYETLVSAPEAQSRRMVGFVGLGWDEACLRPERNTRPIGTASAWQARQPVHAGSVARWRRYEAWLGELRGLAAEAV